MSDSYADTILATSGLVAYWRLGEASGTTGANSVIDASGNGRHGTPTSVTFGTTGATVYSDTAATFNGTSSVISVGASTALAPANVSVEFWYARTGTAAQVDIIWAKPSATYNGSGYYVEWINNFSAGVPALFIQVNGANSVRANIDFNSYAIGAWNHYVVTFSGGVGTIYVNGVSQAVANSGTPTAITATTDTKYLMQNSPGYGTFSPGKLDELAIYSRVLTAAEALAHYNAGQGVFSSLLLRRRRCA